MQKGFTHNNIEALPDNDLRHINNLIDSDVLRYIESLESTLNYVMRELLKYEPENEFLLTQLELDEERDQRLGKKNNQV